MDKEFSCVGAPYKDVPQRISSQCIYLNMQIITAILLILSSWDQIVLSRYLLG